MENYIRRKKTQRYQAHNNRKKKELFGERTNISQNENNFGNFVSNRNVKRVSMNKPVYLDVSVSEISVK